MTMNCTVTWTGAAGAGPTGMTFQAETGSGHVVVMDGAPEGGGRNLGPRPMEMVLLGTGGCTAYDVVLILRKSGQDVRGCDTRLVAERAPTDPKVFTRIEFHFTVRGRGLKPNLVEYSPTAAINTHPMVIAGAIEALYKLGAARVTVAEGPGHVRDTQMLIEECGLAEQLKAVGRSRFVDLNFDDVSRVPLRTGLTSLGELTVKIRLLPQVVVARVNGAAIGGGCGLTTVCDFAITHADSRMGFPEVDLGVCPAVVAPWLTRRLGAGRARAVLLKGGLMTGAEAHALGMVHAVVATVTELDAATAELVKQLAAGGPDALRATKGLLNELDGSADLALIRRAAALSAQVLGTPDAQARLRAKLGA